MATPRFARSLIVASLVCTGCMTLAGRSGAATLTIASTSVSATQARDGVTLTLGYQITSDAGTSASLAATMTDPGGKVAGDMGSDHYGAPYSISVTTGTNWYYRDFLINLPPSAQTGSTIKYDVKYTVNWGASSTTTVTKTKLVTMLAPISVRLPILMYHKIGGATYSQYWNTTNMLTTQMAALKAYGYTALTSRQLMDIRAGLAQCPAKPMMITFDGGYQNFYQLGLPIVMAQGFKPVLFQLTGYMGMDNSWDGDNNPVIMFMTNAELSACWSTGMLDAQDHTVTHPNMTTISTSAMRTELVNSRSTILSCCPGAVVDAMAYPYGSYNNTVKQAVRDSYYFCAHAASGGVETNCIDKYALKRIEISSSTVTDYSPGNASHFFFTMIGDPLTIPTITINSVEVADPVTGNVLPNNQASWGQTVRVRVTATNGGAAAGAVASLTLTCPGYGTVYDSYATDPAHEPKVTSWTGQHVFEWLWTVPIDAPTGQYTAAVNFHDQYFVLGFGSTSSPAFYVQTNVLDLRYVKLAGDGTWNTFRGAVVTATFPDYFYIEKIDRAVGIRVEKPAHGISAGTRVDVAGMMANSLTTGERCILASAVNPTGSRVIAPVAMTGSSLGGGPLGHQNGIWKWEQVLNLSTGEYENTWALSTGLSNIGLLVRVSGRIVSMDADAHTLVIDDGSGSSIKCVWDDRVSVSQSWTYVTITGISSCENLSGQLGRLVLMVSAQGE